MKFVPLNILSPPPPPPVLLLTVPRCSFFWESILSLYVFLFAYVCSCSLMITYWVRANLLAYVCVRDVFLCFCHFPIQCLRSSVVFDCIISWSLLSFFLCFSVMMHYISHETSIWARIVCVLTTTESRVWLGSKMF